MRSATSLRMTILAAQILAAVVPAVATLPATVVGQERMSRSYDARDGLSAPTVFSLAQDSARFLWVGTIGGLYRFDGVEMRRWAADSIAGRVERLAAPGDGRVAALEETGSLWWGGPAGARSVHSSSGAPLRDVLDVAAGAVGELWVLREGGELWRRTSDGGWHPLESDAFGEETPRRVFEAPAGGVDVSTGRGLWHVPVGDRPRRLASVERVVDVVSLPDGQRAVLTFWREAFLLEEGSLRRIMDVPGRGVDLALRQGVLWAAFDRYLVRFESGREPRVLGPEDGIEAGGPLLVDHEESLWMGSFVALHQFPEPETVRWADADGLPSAHTRFLARTGDTLWVSTWQGAARLVETDRGWSADTVRAWLTRSEVATDGEGDLWVGTSRGLLEHRSGRGARVVDPDVGALSAVASGREGELWLGGRGRLLRARTSGFGPGSHPRVEAVPGPDLTSNSNVSALLEDEDGRLWVAADERICRVEARAARRAATGMQPDWRCWSFPGAVHFTSLVRTPGGSLWASSPYAGILRRREGRWEPVPAVAGLASRSVLNLVSSPSGGLWVLGQGILLRVRPDPEAEGGWEVLERLSTWHGLPTPGGADLIEEPGGTLWITTSRGLVRVPAGVRRRSPLPPPVALVEGRVDDEELELEGRPVLPHDRNRLELRFAALSYRAPRAVRYQVRMLPEQEWSDARSQPVVRWVDLDAGDHLVEVRASLDGEHWSEPAASFAFEVLPPWYLEPRWITVFLLALLLVGLLAYRARVGHLLELERQRTRIAMDLHDEIGSALGSIGIQADMLARADIDPSRRRRLANAIADTAGALGTVLADIVWSLAPRSSPLADLALRLEERGRQLFADDGTDFEVQLPEDWPGETLAAPVRRHALMIGLEALENAATHSEADRVTLSLEPADEAAGWRLAVRDDGRGFDPGEVEEGDGMGLLSMRRRADEMGGGIAWRRPGDGEGGTEVCLTFTLRGRSPLIRRIRRRWSRVRARLDEWPE